MRELWVAELGLASKESGGRTLPAIRLFSFSLSPSLPPREARHCGPTVQTSQPRLRGGWRLAQGCVACMGQRLCTLWPFQHLCSPNPVGQVDFHHSPRMVLI